MNNTIDYKPNYDYRNPYDDANSENEIIKIKKLQKSKDELKESLNKIKENDNLSKTISDLVTKEFEKRKVENKSPSFNSNTFIETQFSERNKAINYELDHLKQENLFLKNDNMILKEEVSRLNEIGIGIERELEFSRRKK